MEYALKETALVIATLLKERQTILLRKGGIHEPSGQFQIEARKFYLFPTYYHVNHDHFKPEVWDWIKEIENKKPPEGEIHIPGWSELIDNQWIGDEEELIKLGPKHIWSEDYILERFHSGNQPGLNCLTLHTHRLDPPLIIPYDPSYQGCRSWAELKL